MEKKYLNDEFNFFWEKIEKGDNFALLRHGDGERAIMQGRSVTAQEGWKSPEYITKLGRDCLEALQVDDENYWIGISCPCCDRSAYYWYMTRTKGKNITFANIWVNNNYKDFYTKFSKLERDAVIIANHTAENKKIGNLNILKFYSVGDDCIDFWEKSGEQLVDTMMQEYGSRNDILYVISAGPMSGPIIKRLYDNNPNNCYIDFGSSIDEFIHEKKTRPYMDENTVYAKQKCWMYDPHEISFDVTVVCTLYKRPESLVKQIEALENQSLRPKAIFLFQDGIADFYKVEMLDTLKSKFSNIRIADCNMGVWERFRLALEAKTPYVCIFDDDTIPGNSWLENCHFHMQQQEGIFGTNGIVMTDKQQYPLGGYFPVGWKGPVAECTEVDFVGHSWFMRSEWLPYMFDGTEKFQAFKYAAEDMCLSVKAKEKGIKTFVPPHPNSDKTLWGSTPIFGDRFGNAVEALSFNVNNLERMQKAIAMFEESGWSPMCVDEPQKVKVASQSVSREKKRNFYQRSKNFIKREFLRKEK